MNEALVAQKGPFAVELEARRRYAWWACGRGKKQPFCHGSHSETSLLPVIFKAVRTGTAWLCGCKTTGERPFCDGSHHRL